MRKSGKKPVPDAIPAAGKRPAGSPLPPARHGSATNSRLQPDQRWQRTKRYGWNSR